MALLSGRVESLYILSPPVGKALGSQSELPALLRHTSPLGVTSKAIPGQPRGLEKCSLSGQLFGRHQAAVIPKGEEPGWEEPAELLHPPPGGIGPGSCKPSSPGTASQLPAPLSRLNYPFRAISPRLRILGQRNSLSPPSPRPHTDPPFRSALLFTGTHFVALAHAGREPA